jgi:phage replication O-like protein O
MIERPMENWTRMPNCILDNLEKYSGSELKVLAWMVRQTFGWHKEASAFSIRYIMKWTGLKSDTVQKAITGLVDKKSITKSGEGKRGVFLYTILWDRNVGESTVPAPDGTLTVPNSGTVDISTVPNSGTVTVPNSGTILKKEDKERRRPATASVESESLFPESSQQRKPEKANRTIKRPSIPEIWPDFEHECWKADNTKQLDDWAEFWSDAYPDIDVIAEGIKALAEAAAHPERCYKKWFIYLANWMRRAQGFKERDGARAS